METAKGIGAVEAPSGQVSHLDRVTAAAAETEMNALSRVWCERTAENEAILVYAVSTIEQLANVTRQRPATKAALRLVEGVGEDKAEQYGAGVLEVVTAGVDTKP